MKNLNFAIPYGMRRISNSRTINKAKNRIDFTIVDQEFRAAPFPPGITYCEATYEIRNTGPRNLQMWLATLSARYEVAPGYERALAAGKFLTLMNDRVERVRAGVPPENRGTILPISLSWSIELYGRSTSLSITFTITATADKMLEKSGAWEPVPENDWQEWYRVLNVARVFDNRGHSGIGFDPAEDRLVTICLGAGPEQEEEEDTTEDDTFDSASESSENTGVLDDQTTDGGYLIYESQVQQMRSENFIVHRFAQEYQPGDEDFQDNLVEYTSPPDNYIVMTGRGVRVGMLPDPPQVLMVGGKQVELLKRVVHADDKPMTFVFGHSVFAASWELWYRVKGDPQAQTPVTIPILQTPQPEPLEAAGENGEGTLGLPQ